MGIFNELEQRGFIYQISDQQKAEEVASTGPQLAYGGFDCTAPSLHVGNLTLIMLLRRWQKAGHRPIVLFGGATTLIGDPTGKEQARQMLTPEIVAQNKASIAQIMARFLDFDDPQTGAIIVDNADWWGEKKYMNVLREIGPLMTVNRMLTFETIDRRIASQKPLSFLEFNYMILQGYDFVHLYKEHGCRYQFGGSDQWGNMIVGLELGHKMQQPEMFVMTAPLMTNAAGLKMGKTEKGAVWLNPDYLDDYDYWQFWRNVDDQKVDDFLKIFTDLSLEQIEQTMGDRSGADYNKAKELLANEQTRLCRGEEAQKQAQARAAATFGSTNDGTLDHLPAYELSVSEQLLVDFLSAHGLVDSKSQARKLMTHNGVKINGQVITDLTYMLKKSDLVDAQMLSIGKKRHYRMI